MVTLKSRGLTWREWVELELASEGKVGDWRPLQEIFTYQLNNIYHGYLEWPLEVDSWESSDILVTAWAVAAASSGGEEWEMEVEGMMQLKRPTGGGVDDQKLSE